MKKISGLAYAQVVRKGLEAITPRQEVSVGLVFAEGPTGPGAGVHCQVRSRLNSCGRDENLLHREGQSLGKRLLRELQSKTQRRAAQRRDLLQSEGGQDRHLISPH